MPSGLLFPAPWKNVLPEHLQQQVQFFPGGVPAEGDPEGTVHDFRGQVHGGEDVAAVTFGTGGTGADTDARVLQNVDGILGGNSGNGKGENVRRFVTAVDLNAVKFT